MIIGKGVDPHRQGRAKRLQSFFKYAYDDACICFAKALGKENVAEKYFQRSQNWTNVFDSTTGFMRQESRRKLGDAVR